GLRDERPPAFAGRRLLWYSASHCRARRYRKRRPCTVKTRSVTNLLLDYGLVLLFVLVAIESAGIPLPGETALVAAAVLAHDHYGIVWVIVVAAAGAIVGDNVGYWLGRFGGRRLLERWRVTRRYAERALPPAERFFQRHGGKTVFFGRFFAFLRVTAAWL